VTTAHSPWNIEESDFPIEGTLGEQVAFCLGYAVLAPSGHNTQPWRFRIVQGSEVQVFADRSRALPVVDPDDRELVLSCGAALFFLRVALSHFGLGAQTQLCPRPDQPDLLATVRVGADGAETLAGLFDAIGTRSTNREAFEDEVVPAELRVGLRDAAQRESCRLWSSDRRELREALAALVAQGDVEQMADSAFRTELAHWVRRSRASTHDGMPAYAFGVNEHLDFVTPLAALTIRRFNRGKSQAAKDHELAVGSPLLAVLSTEGDGVEDWMRAGQALARVLLLAEANGLRASYLNQPIEVAALRARVGAIADGAACPQVLLRMGFGPPRTPPTPRRPVAEVLEVD